ncbi:EAL domain-containing protein [Chryseomicrobium sp. FSL W7-1435]|uniref:EAL domain-containing protein n=1 Tax=Chryseomicrobium sp. FSL W7-1435 TaxID=2921704 RepID=UPI00315AA37C
MGCQGCTVTDLRYTFQLSGEHNLSLIDAVYEFLKRNEIPVDQTNREITLPEHHVPEVINFFEDHLDIEQILFKTEQTEWTTLSELGNFLELSWIDEIILQERVECHYQPIIRSDGMLFGYELLARFKDAEGKAIFPNEAFDAARSRGRLYALDRMCRMAAVRHAARLERVKAFINFIPTSIYSPEFCLRSTMQLASKLNVDPQQLVFEVVETEQVDDVQHLKDILTYYKEKGFMYALDDMGEGFSTLEMLTGIEPHYMKLDRKYVTDIHEDQEKQRVALQFLTQARKMGTVPLAEGIETEQEYNWLKESGYVLFQGYYIGRPQPEPATIDALNF